MVQRQVYVERIETMAKRKRKRTAAERRAKREFRRTHMRVFIHGKQKWVRRPVPVLVEGLPVDEFIAKNADPIWLHQHELWHLMPPKDRDSP